MKIQCSGRCIIKKIWGLRFPLLLIIMSSQLGWISWTRLANPPNHLWEDPNLPPNYTLQDNILWYKERLVLSLTSTLEPKILNELLLWGKYKLHTLWVASMKVFLFGMLNCENSSKFDKWRVVKNSFVVFTFQGKWESC
jgi:hypothetical protein